MTEAEFTGQMNRLAETFGRAAYSTERVRLIWREVKDMPGDWLRGVADDFIGSERQAPLLPAFRERVAAERERRWREERREHKQDAKDFFGGSVLSDDDRGMLAQAIRRRLAGTISEDDWKAVLRSMAFLETGKESA